MRSMICITGATGGLGRAFAVECACRGWDLFLTDISVDALKTLAYGISGAYMVNVDFYSSDLTDIGSREELFQYIKGKELVFHGLINIAGLDFEGPFAQKTPEQIRTILRLNIEANLEMTFEALKHREKGRTFRIINVSSLASFYPMPVKATYAASKRFLLDFSLAIREELRQTGCTVTVLCPAGMPTNPLCIRAIDVQGFMGRMTTKNVGYVAAKTIDYALKGRPVYIPGIVNKILGMVSKFIPSTAAAKLIYERWA
jgi:short-subunit dehydrogenase